MPEFELTLRLVSQLPVISCPAFLKIDEPGLVEKHSDIGSWATGGSVRSGVCVGWTKVCIRSWYPVVWGWSCGCGGGCDLKDKHYFAAILFDVSILN